MSQNYTLKIGDYNVEAFHVGELNVVKIYKGDVLIYEKQEPGPIEDLDEMVRQAIASKNIQRCQEVGAYVEEQTRGTSETKYRYAAAKDLEDLVDVNPSDIELKDYNYNATSGPLSQEVVDVNLMSLEDTGNPVYSHGGNGFFSNCKVFNSPVPSLTNIGTVFSEGPIEQFLSDLPNLLYGEQTFRDCTKLTQFIEDYPEAKLPKLKNGRRMFKGCTNLLSFQVMAPKLEDGTEMFEGCTNLYSVSGTENVSVATNMFNGCSSLAIIIPDYYNVVTGDSMYANCNSLIDFYSNMPKLAYCTSMFEGCSQLTNFSSDLRGLSNPLSDGAWNMFLGCQSLSFVEPKNVKGYVLVDHIIRSLPENLSDNDHTFSFSYFNEDGSEDYLDGATLNSASSALIEKGWICTYTLHNGNSKYENDTNFVNWNIDTPSLTTAERMFYKSNKLETFTADLSSLTSGYEMFFGDIDSTTQEQTGKLNTLDIKSLDSLSIGSYMFCNQKLTEFTYDLPSLTGEGGRLDQNHKGYVETSDCMFMGCRQLQSFTGSLSNLKRTYMFLANCNNLTTFTSNLNSLQYGYYMFYGCNSLQSFNVQLPSLIVGHRMFSDSGLVHWNIDMPNLQYLGGYDDYSGGEMGMFQGCEQLETFTSNMPRLGNSLSSGISQTEYAFKGCTNLKSVEIKGTTAENAFNGIINSLPSHGSAPTSTHKFIFHLNSAGQNDMAIRIADLARSKGWTPQNGGIISGSGLYKGNQSISDWETDLPNLETGGDGNDTSETESENNNGMFQNSSVTNVGSETKSVDISKVTKSSAMYRGCTSLLAFYANLQRLIVANYMFAGCTLLQKFSASLNNITNANGMFRGCSSLSSFDGQVSTIVNAKEMFKNCVLLTSWNKPLTNLQNGVDMFNGTGLTSFSTPLPALQQANSMFRNCTKLTSFSTDISHLSNCSYMFANTGFTNWSHDLPNLITATGMFQGCSKLNTFSLSSLSGLTIANDMFKDCTELNEFTTDLPQVTDAQGMFDGCTSITTFISDLSSLRGAYFTNMFRNCRNLTHVEPKNLDNSDNEINRIFDALPSHTVNDGTHKFILDNTEAKAMKDAFIKGANKGWTLVSPISSLSISSNVGWFTGNTELVNVIGELPYVLNANDSFRDCSNLVELKLSTPSLTSAHGMFMNCSKLQNIDIDFSNNTGWSNTFTGCTSLQSIRIKMLQRTDLRNMFNADQYNTVLTAHIDAPNSTNANWLFLNRTGITEFTGDLSSATTASAAFKNCTSLTSFEADLSSLIGSTNEMFQGCTQLSHFSSNLSSLTNGSNMFTDCCLDADSVINIANTLNRNVTNSPRIDIGIGDRQLTSNEITALNSLISKWTVYINGSQYYTTIPSPGGGSSSGN